MRLLFIMGILSFFLGAKANAQGNDVKLIPLESKQLKLISTQASDGKVFLEKYIGKKSGYTPSDIDNAILSWRKSPDKQRESNDFVIEVLGSYFGEYLTKKLNVEWINYKDNQGNDLCVIHKEISVYSFPYSAIYKAVVEKRENALENVVAALSQQISDGLKDKNVKNR
jgi:hypothetical protein